MLTKSNIFVCGLIMGFFSPILTANDNPPRTLGTHTRPIDDALLMTEFTVLGIEFSFEKEYLKRQPTSAEIECAHTKLIPLVRRHFDSAIESSLSTSELSQGSQLASAKVFIVLNEYIKAHREELTEQAKEKPNLNPGYFFLAHAATKLQLPAKDQYQIRDFIIWHSSVGGKIRKSVDTLTPNLVQDVARIFVGCRSAP